jgi:thiamine-phosphate pyrophosphorylase
VRSRPIGSNGTPASASKYRAARDPVALPRGLYALTPDEQDTDRLVKMVRAAIEGGASAVQYRNKLADHRMREIQAHSLLQLCRHADVPLIVNDDVELAVRVGADGVHVGRSDSSVAEARARLGPDRILGASCYDRIDLALAARAAGASYVAFGSVFASSVKPGAVRAPLELFREARRRVGLRLCAIGGITAENARGVIEAGADAVAVITDLFGAPDIAARAREYERLFRELEEPWTPR